MKIFFRSHSILFAIFILLVSRIVGLGVVFAIQYFNPDINPIKDLGWLIQILFASTAILLVFWSGDSREIGFTKPKSKKEWLLWLPPLVIPFYIIWTLGFNVTDSSTALILTITALCVAVNEEVIFRGVIVKGLLRYGILVTLIVPSLLFGLIHLGNILGGGDMKFAIFQVTWAIAAGIGLTALRIRNGSLYPAIAFHFLIDLFEYFGTGENGIHQDEFSTLDLSVLLSLLILFMIYGLILYQKRPKFN